KNATPEGKNHGGLPAKHAARRAAHDVEHVERNTNAEYHRICSARHGDGRLTIRQKRATPRKREKDTAKGQKRARPLHSIISSARESSENGTVRPRALAVLRLITSSKRVGSVTGNSAGFSPLSTRPT